MKNSLIISAALLIYPAATLAAGDPARGKTLIGACVACPRKTATAATTAQRPTPGRALPG